MTTDDNKWKTMQVETAIYYEVGDVTQSKCCAFHYTG
jgi:hypothetical protein